jgi:hypothetical protein
MRTFIVLSAAFLFGGVFAAQSRDQPAPVSMAQCRSDCQTLSGSVERALAALDEADRSEDPAKVKAALKSARESLMAVKEHMSTCATISGMGMPHMMHPEEKSPEPAPVPDR